MDGWDSKKALELQVRAMLSEYSLRSIIDELVCACDRHAEARMQQAPELGKAWLQAGKEVHRVLTRLDAQKLDL